MGDFEKIKDFACSEIFYFLCPMELEDYIVPLYQDGSLFCRLE